MFNVGKLCAQEMGVDVDLCASLLHQYKAKQHCSKPLVVYHGGEAKLLKTKENKLTNYLHMDLHSCMDAFTALPIESANSGTK